MWKEKFKEMLPLLGHRNWVLVVDKAFPLQSASEMRYFDTGQELPEILSFVLEEIVNSGHLKPVVYRDKELGFLSGCGNPEIAEYKQKLNIALSTLNGPVGCNEILHDDVFGKMKSASDLFVIIVLKTETRIPYSSVFIELGCGYWNDDAEARLRKEITVSSERPEVG